MSQRVKLLQNPHPARRGGVGEPQKWVRFLPKVPPTEKGQSRHLWGGAPALPASPQGQLPVRCGSTGTSDSHTKSSARWCWKDRDEGSWVKEAHECGQQGAGTGAGAAATRWHQVLTRAPR